MVIAHSPTEIALRKRLVDMTSPDNPNVSGTREVVRAAEAVTGIAWKLYDRQPGINSDVLKAHVEAVLSQINGLRPDASNYELKKAFGRVEDYVSKNVPDVYDEERKPFLDPQHPGHKKSVLMINSFFSKNPQYLPEIVKAASDVVSFDQGAHRDFVGNSSYGAYWKAINRSDKPADDERQGLNVSRAVNTVVQKFLRADPNIKLEDLRVHSRQAIKKACQEGTLGAVDDYIRKNKLNVFPMAQSNSNGQDVAAARVLIDCVSKGAHLKHHYLERVIQKLDQKRRSDEYRP